MDVTSSELLLPNEILQVIIEYAIENPPNGFIMVIMTVNKDGFTMNKIASQLNIAKAEYWNQLDYGVKKYRIGPMILFRSTSYLLRFISGKYSRTNIGESVIL